MQRSERQSRPDRWVLFPFGIVLGAVVAGFELSNGDPGSAAFALALFAAFGAVLGWGRFEWVLAGSGSGDERQREIGDEAVKLAYFAVITVAVPGWLWSELRHGVYGPFGVICSVGGCSNLLALAVLARRR